MGVSCSLELLRFVVVFHLVFLQRSLAASIYSFLAVLSRFSPFDFDSVPCSLFIRWLSVTADALIVESSPWYLSTLCVVLSCL